MLHSYTYTIVITQNSTTTGYNQTLSRIPIITQRVTLIGETGSGTKLSHNFNHYY